MSRRGEIQRHLDALRDIDGVMRAMKNLSLVEIHKLDRVAAHQLRALSTIELALEEFAAGFPAAAPADAVPRPGLLLAIGSERGFCGDFNESLAGAIRAHWREQAAPAERAIVVGGRLAARLDGERCIVAALRGPSVAEEVPVTIERVMRALHELFASDGGRAVGALSVIAHRGDDGVPVSRRVFPPLPHSLGARHTNPPCTYLGPRELYAGLLDQYLWAVLHASFYGSLMAENRKRLRQMEGAIRRIEERGGALQRRAQLLRQEEITEEIEIIMLSNDALARTG